MPTTSAMTIRKGKEPMVIDGPFAETKEALLGFFIVDCESLVQAIETAKELASGYFYFFGLARIRNRLPNGNQG